MTRSAPPLRSAEFLGLTGRHGTHEVDGKAHLQAPQSQDTDCITDAQIQSFVLFRD
ncbi:MAG: hypothetical protein MI923_28330 [Phycisphaerales bacterium]|nr:hypothetical protein [Phycisphaerales bacterium]